MKVCLTERELLPRVRREGKAQESHGRNKNTWDDQVEEIVKRSPPDLNGERDIYVGFRTTLVLHLVLLARHACNLTSTTISIAAIETCQLGK